MLLNLAVHLTSCAGGRETPGSIKYSSSWLSVSFKFMSKSPNNGDFLRT